MPANIDALFDDAIPTPTMRPLGAGVGWSLNEFTCVAGPEDRPFEEEHDGFCIAAVVEGTFNYRSSQGGAFLHPGALLLGNRGACYECGHDHGRGDRCISLRLSAELFEEIAATAAGGSDFRFPCAALPARRELLPHLSVLEATARGGERLRKEEGLIRLASATISALSGVGTANSQRVSALDTRRVGRALNYMEREARSDLDLDRIAQAAAMSKFHFLRVFRRVVGMTPWQYMLALRLRMAAARLLATTDSVTAIAFEAGFNDLSGFNATFRQTYGCSPGVFRRQARTSAP